jgi:hypothetical protein
VFGRGLCHFQACGCATFAAEATPPEDYTPFRERSTRYGLVLHRGNHRHLFGGYDAPELITDVPTVDQAVYELVRHRVGHQPSTQGPHRAGGEFFYADWGGGRLNEVSEGWVAIYRCGCRALFHIVGESDLVGVSATLGPALSWANLNTARRDWVELVPVPPPATVHRGPVELVVTDNGQIRVLCPRGHLITALEPGQPWTGSALAARYQAGWEVECDRRDEMPGFTPAGEVARV